MELTNVTCVNFIWRAVTDVVYGVVMLMTGVKGQNGFVNAFFSKQDEVECQQKWEDILQYQHVGIYSVADGRTFGCTKFCLPCSWNSSDKSCCYPWLCAMTKH